MSHQLTYRSNVMATGSNAVVAAAPATVQYVLNTISAPTAKQGGGGKQEVVVQTCSDAGGAQLGLLKAQNAELQTKLHHVNRENGQLNDKMERIRADLTDLKSIIERCNATLNSGMSVDSEFLRGWGGADFFVYFCFLKQLKTTIFVVLFCPLSLLSLPAINAGIKQLVAEGLKKVRAKKSYNSKKGGGKKGASNCSCCYVAEKPHACDWEVRRRGERTFGTTTELNFLNLFTPLFSFLGQNCGKRFSQRAHLEAHRNVHLGARFQCSWPNCTKTFCRKYSLVEHEQIHRAGNPNTCRFPGCDKSFSTKYGLQRHQGNQNHQGY